jgi:DNA-binding winged helix-turn-helix (wHTH) protein
VNNSTRDTLADAGGLRRDLPLTMTGTREVFSFGEFELDVEAGELRRKNRRLKLQPQPFKLLLLLVRKNGALVTRDEIRRELWPDGTFVDFDQAVNFSIKQIRDVLGDEADQPLYIETVPRRGHRFIAPISTPGHPPPRQSFIPMGATGIRLEKALWTNIAELRLAESRRRRYLWLTISVLAVLLMGAAILLIRR